VLNTLAHVFLYVLNQNIEKEREKKEIDREIYIEREIDK
jgi:hypothetical protein